MEAQSIVRAFRAMLGAIVIFALIHLPILAALVRRAVAQLERG